MKKYLLLFLLPFFTFCSKDEVMDDFSDNVFKVSTVSINGVIQSKYEYYSNGKLFKCEKPNNELLIYEYKDNEVTLISYNLDIIYGQINKIRYSKKYTLNSQKLAVSSITQYSAQSNILNTYEYDSNGFLVKVNKTDEVLNYTIQNSNTSSVSSFYQGNLDVTINYEYFQDKINDTNFDLVTHFEIDKTGVNFLGKRSKNLLKKIESLKTGTIIDYSYITDSIGRISKIILSYDTSVLTYQITYVE